MVVQELIAKLGFDVDQGGLNSVDNALGNFAKKLTIAAAGIYAVKKAVEATVWAISGSIEAAAQKEDVTTQFKVMLGDLEAAKYLYQEINQYAAVSPFETAGLADNVRQMMSFGQTLRTAMCRPASMVRMRRLVTTWIVRRAFAQAQYGASNMPRPTSTNISPHSVMPPIAQTPQPLSGSLALSA